MEVTTTFTPQDRQQWRAWLRENHASAKEIWLLYTEQGHLSYLDSVEEALCFGWIDGLQKRLSGSEKAQRFTPRRPRSRWTELNKERARRLIRLGLMTKAGAEVLPDLEEPFVVASDITQAIRAIPEAWRHFERLPDLYLRVRIGYIEEMRKNPAEFTRRLQNFIRQTAAGKRFGNWNDGGRLLSPY